MARQRALKGANMGAQAATAADAAVQGMRQEIENLRRAARVLREVQRAVQTQRRQAVASVAADLAKQKPAAIDSAAAMALVNTWQTQDKLKEQQVEAVEGLRQAIHHAYEIDRNDNPAVAWAV